MTFDGRNYAKEYYQRNKEKIQRQNKANYQKNRSKRIQAMKKYQEDNAINIQRYKRIWHQQQLIKNPGCGRNQSKICYINNRQKMLNKTRQWKFDNPEKRHAENRLHNLFTSANIKTDNEFICAMCDNKQCFKIAKHHFDYSLWNWFIPLCYRCHRNIHNIDN